MNRLLALLFIAIIPLSVLSKKKPKSKGYEFKMLFEVPTTPVKNQYRTGTCWSFSGLAFFETELLRMGKGEYDLAEMFIVRQAYIEKAQHFVRFHGKTNFGNGGIIHDVLYNIKNYGLMPESAYPGLEYDEPKHVHAEMDALLSSYVNTVIQNKNKKLSPVWLNGFEGILDAYLGNAPEEFEVEGKTYTPKSFADNLGINVDDYVILGSYTHHPFYESFVIEIPDNWLRGSIYNLPLEDMTDIVNNAIKNGYSVGWGADVSEKGFSWKNGVAIVPDDEKPELDNLEQGKWEALDDKEKQELLYKFENPIKEKIITQDLRQKQFDNYLTTDDHGMLLTGIAEDQNGNIYYKVKNSWSESGNDYKGFFFASKAFFELKTINVWVHKDALSAGIKAKLGIE
ncbi:MAG: aminopeptidase [Bacteroidales bacterium]|jgi:bleomycin hydrolase|nr:aminopeptidase [Bacteroidales bacterium]